MQDPITAQDLFLIYSVSILRPTLPSSTPTVSIEREPFQHSQMQVAEPVNFIWPANFVSRPPSGLYLSFQLAYAAQPIVPLRPESSCDMQSKESEECVGED